MSIPYTEIHENSMLNASPHCFAQFWTFTLRDTIGGDPVSTRKASVFSGAPKISSMAGNETGIDVKGIIHNGDLDEALEVKLVKAASDIISCRVSKTKGNATGSWEMTLSPRQDYHSLIHPGDHVLIWMRRSKRDEPLDGARTSGFKMWGIVSGVRRQRTTLPDGHKVTRHVISGADWGYYFETDIYFNRIMAQNLQNQQVMYNILGAPFDTYDTIERNVVKLLDGFLGKLQLNNLNPVDVASPNKAFKLPGPITKFFAGDTDTMNGIVRRQVGLAQYENGDLTPKRITALPGWKLIKGDPGSKFSLWSILQTYSNPTLNEMFLELLPDEKGFLRPTIVVRQIPYTSDVAASLLAKENIEFTTFRSLPRFRVPESFLISEDIGRSDQMRINFLQLFGNGTTDAGFASQVQFQTLMGNFAIDVRSIARYGVRASLPKTDSDLRIPTPPELLGAHFRDLFKDAGAETKKLIGNPQLTGGAALPPKSATYIVDWTKLLADWWLSGDMLESGTFVMPGIEELISIGTNLEIVRQNGQRELYHIQGYNHSFGVEPDGHKSFKTTIAVTRGQLENGDPLFRFDSKSGAYVSTGVET